MGYGPVLGQQRIADLEQQLHHAESASAETRAAQWDARQNGVRAIDLMSIETRASFGEQARGFRNFRFQFVAYCVATAAANRREMKEASRSEAPIPTEAMRQEEAARSRQLYYMLVLWCTTGAMEVMENVPDGEGHEASRRLHHACDSRLPG